MTTKRRSFRRTPPKEKTYPDRFGLVLDVPAFDRVMAREFGARTDEAMAEALRLDRSTVGRLRGGDTRPGVAFLGACRAAGLNDHEFTTTVITEPQRRAAA